MREPTDIFGAARKRELQRVECFEILVVRLMQLTPHQNDPVLHAGMDYIMKKITFEVFLDVVTANAEVLPREETPA